MTKKQLPCVPVYKENVVIKKEMKKCIGCKKCIEACDKEVGVIGHYLKQEERKHFDCLECGQCLKVCPTGAMTYKKDYEQVREAILNPEKIVIVSTAPAVRVGLGDFFRSQKGTFVEGEMVTALRKLGADYVFDLTFGADLTIIEESMELVERLTYHQTALPLMTSCCPAWVKYVNDYHRELLPNLSSCKSPVMMQGAILKTYFAKQKDLDPARIVTVTIVPCVTKKAEIAGEETSGAGQYWNQEKIRDNDYIITTEELAEWMKQEKLDIKDLDCSAYDELFTGSGSGLIFGNTGGVAEAIIRTTYSLLNGGRMCPKYLLNFRPVRGMAHFKETIVNMGVKTIKVGVYDGLKDLEEMGIKKLQDYDLIEVMACPGGCIGGVGQRVTQREEAEERLVYKNRIQSLYEKEAQMPVRNALQNETVIKIYHTFLKGDLAKRLLHIKR